MKIPMVIKNSFCRYLFTAIIAVALSSLLLLFGRSIVGTFIGINENFYLKYYYDWVNSPCFVKTAWSDKVPDSIVVVNIQNYRNRHDIAKILNKVYSLNPRVIGLDVYFKNNSDVKDSIDIELINVLKKVQDKTIVACLYSTDEKGIVHTIYPYFYGVEGLESITYASVLGHDLFGHYSYDDSSIPNKETLSPILPEISAEIARKSRINMRDSSDVFYVNYAKKELYEIKDTSELRSFIVQDKIILIGDMSDIKDMTELPFRFGDKEIISGIEDIAYTLISLRKYDHSFLNKNMRFIGFQDWSPFWSILLSLSICFIFCFVINWYRKKKYRALIKNKYCASFFVLMQPILFILAEFVIVIICFLITRLTNSIPDLFISMVALAFVNSLMEVINIIFNK